MSSLSCDRNFAITVFLAVLRDVLVICVPSFLTTRSIKILFRKGFEVLQTHVNRSCGVRSMLLCFVAQNLAIIDEMELLKLIYSTLTLRKSVASYFGDTQCYEINFLRNMKNAVKLTVTAPAKCLIPNSHCLCSRSTRKGLQSLCDDFNLYTNEVADP